MASGLLVGRNDLLGRERGFGQGGAPALQHVLGQQHLLARLSMVRLVNRYTRRAANTASPCLSSILSAHRHWRLPSRKVTHTVLTSAVLFFAIVSTGGVRGFHLMMKAISAL